MADYQDLKKRLDASEVIILDGAVGTQLQAMGAAMDPYCWAAMANHTHPYTVRKMHEDYIRAGADVITTNTYSSAHHNYEAAGLADLTFELNLRAVVLAQEARDRVAEKPVYIAGSISNFGAWTEHDVQGWLKNGMLRGRNTSLGMRLRNTMTVEQIRRNLHEQAEMLAEAGVDLIIAEATGDTEQRGWVLEAAASVGLPFWAGFKCHVDEGEDQVRVGYQSDLTLGEELDVLLPADADVVNIFHSAVQDTTMAIPVVKARWSGPVGAYPEAGRRDYVRDLADPTEKAKHTPAEWVTIARGWVAQGVQVIGGCCGMGVEYTRALNGKLPKTV